MRCCVCGARADSETFMYILPMSNKAVHEDCLHELIEYAPDFPEDDAGVDYNCWNCGERAVEYVMDGGKRWCMDCLHENMDYVRGTDEYNPWLDRAIEERYRERRGF